MPSHNHPTRRNLLAGAIGVAAAGIAAPSMATAADDTNWKIVNGRVNQAVVHWCFNSIDVETLCRGAAAMGLKSVELIDPKHWPILKKHGLA